MATDINIKKVLAANLPESVANTSAINLFFAKDTENKVQLYTSDSSGNILPVGSSDSSGGENFIIEIEEGSYYKGNNNVFRSASTILPTSSMELNKIYIIYFYKYTGIKANYVTYTENPQVYTLDKVSIFMKTWDNNLQKYSRNDLTQLLTDGLDVTSGVCKQTFLYATNSILGDKTSFSDLYSSTTYTNPYFFNESGSRSKLIESIDMRYPPQIGEMGYTYYFQNPDTDEIDVSEREKKNCLYMAIPQGDRSYIQKELKFINLNNLTFESNYPLDDYTDLIDTDSIAIVHDGGTTATYHINPENHETADFTVENNTLSPSNIPLVLTNKREGTIDVYLIQGYHDNYRTGSQNLYFGKILAHDKYWACDFLDVDNLLNPNPISLSGDVGNTTNISYTPPRSFMINGGYILPFPQAEANPTRYIDYDYPMEPVLAMGTWRVVDNTFVTWTSHKDLILVITTSFTPGDLSEEPDSFTENYEYI